MNPSYHYENKQSSMKGDPVSHAAHPSRSNTVKQSSRPQFHPTLSRSTSTSAAHHQRFAVPSVPLPEPQQSVEDLRHAMQQAWTMLESNQRANQQNPNGMPARSQQAPLQDAKAAVASPPPAPMPTPTKTAMQRIYIGDTSKHKTIQVSNLMTAAMVIQYFKNKNVLDDSNDWAVFEIATSHGAERPLREWEILMDVSAVWEPEMNNLFLIRKYRLAKTLSNEAILRKRNSAIQGWLSMEHKKGKWLKRFFILSENAIHYAKDSKGSSTTVFCYLSAYDVYTVPQPMRSTPTKYIIGLRAQDSERIYEKEEDYLRFLCAEDSETAHNWILSIRAAKGIMQYHKYPQRVLHPCSPGEWARSEKDPALVTDDTKQIARSLRRHKSARDIKAVAKSDELAKNYPLDGAASLGRQASRRVLGRGNTVRRPDIEVMPDLPDQVAHLKRTQGSSNDSEHSDGPLGHSPSPTEDPQPSTLIQITDKFTFAKGSLLERNQTLSRAKSTRDGSARVPVDPGNGGSVSSNGSGGMPPSATSEPRRHVSVRQNPASSRDRSARHPEPPLPTNNPVSSLDSEDDDQPLAREILGRQTKPFMNYSVSSDTRRRP